MASTVKRNASLTLQEPKVKFLAIKVVDIRFEEAV